MADVFEDNKQVANWRGELFRLIEQTPNLDWLLLTKRPERMFSLGTDAAGVIFDLWLADNPNVWLGTSVESQDYFDERVAALVKYGLQARVLFLSVEPMIGPVRLVPTPTFSAGHWEFAPGKKSHINWVICGGESGAECRPMQVQWARDLRDDCRTHGVKFFMKQLGGFPDKREKLLDLPEDLRVREMPVGVQQ
jgi:protein gp37